MTTFITILILRSGDCLQISLPLIVLFNIGKGGRGGILARSGWTFDTRSYVLFWLRSHAHMGHFSQEEKMVKMCFFLALLLPNSLIFSTFLNCSEEI